jgi:hypothetical protein
MKLKLFILLIIFYANIIAQIDINNLSELQKIYFISETNSLTANFVNPATLSTNKNDDGLILSYDFLEEKNKGNTLASLSMGNLGFVYQDIHSINDLRLSSYALNISVGGSFLSLGSSNKIVDVDYGDYKKSHFLIDAGIIIQPLPILSIGLLAKNLSKTEIDSIEYDQTYSIGANITLVNKIFNIFVQTDFRNSDELSTNVQAVAGFSVTPIEFLELRTWLQGTKNLVNEGIITGIFKIENGIIISASAHFNSEKERTRYNMMIGLPLKTLNF